ncbi:unnamed protein product, partial [Rangifer tarandus platyrhynchus]
GGSGAGTRAGHPSGGPSRCFLPPPPGTQRGRWLRESRARAGHGESMTRPVGTATWGGIGRSRGDRARFADRHFTFCKEGGGSRGIGLLQGKKTRPRDSLHLHSGTQAAWRSPIWSTANLCGRERRQSSERLHWLPPESHTRPFPSHGTGESSLRGCTRLQQANEKRTRL